MIFDKNISPDASISSRKIDGAAGLPLANGKILVGNATGSGAAVTMSGDTTITNAGVMAIGKKKIDDGMPNLASTKFFVGNATGSGVAVAMSGDATMSNTGAVTIAANAVEASMLQTNLQKGYIPLDITSAREIASGTGVPTGVVGSGTTPVLDYGSATNLTCSLTWATGNTDTIGFNPIFIPDDCDKSADMIVTLYGKMGGATDTPTVAVRAYGNDSASDLGGATSAFGSTLAEETKALNISGVSILTICITPGAHGNDTLILNGAYLEYTRQS
jgi:hypothetical protein